MQLYSVDQKRSQALEAHAAAFSTARVPGRAASSTVISFAQKTFNNGTLTSKLHVIELGAPAGQLQFLLAVWHVLPGPPRSLMAADTAAAQVTRPLKSSSTLSLLQARRR
jgi:hypothetical protein